MKLVHGIGINDADYQVQHWIGSSHVMCPFYARWIDMLRRCYSDKFQDEKPTYIDCTVTEEWYTFSNFKKWMECQDWENKDLDKDILVLGNKTYSPTTCIFVSHKINQVFAINSAKNTKYKTGVRFHKRDKKFHSRCGYNGYNKHLGCFDTEIEAHATYLKFKAKYILEIAKENKNNDILYKALILHAENFKRIADATLDT